MSRNFTATRTPQDVGVGIGSLVYWDATKYRIQNVDANARLFIRESVTRPMANHRPHVVEPGEWYGPFMLYRARGDPSFGVWAWSNRDTCACVLSRYVG